MSTELSEGAAVIILASEVRVLTEEGEETLALFISDLEEVLMCESAMQTINCLNAISEELRGPTFIWGRHAVLMSSTVRLDRANPTK